LDLLLLGLVLFFVPELEVVVFFVVPLFLYEDELDVLLVLEYVCLWSLQYLLEPSTS
jgi:hypothetical protein